MKYGHTNRGVSGAFYPQSAIVGVNAQGGPCLCRSAENSLLRGGSLRNSHL